MTPPAVKLLQEPTFKYAMSNYYDGELESLNTIRVSSNTSWGGTISVDLGADTMVKNSNNGIETKTKPGIEVKYKQKFGTATIFEQPVKFEGYARYRHIGDSNKLRFATGVSTPINDKLSASIYTHYTTDLENGQDKIGGWASLEYKVSDKILAWWDLAQVNKTIGGGVNLMTNGGITISLF